MLELPRGATGAHSAGEIPSAGAGATPSPLSGTVLAFDFGAKRTGVAVGEIALRIAHPLSTLHAATKAGRMKAIEAIVGEWRPALLLVGLPTHMDGTEHEMTRLAKNFARDLKARFGLPVEFADERLSSAAAEISLAESGLAARKRKPVLDSVAAQHILQAWLDAARKTS